MSLLASERKSAMEQMFGTIGNGKSKKQKIVTANDSAPKQVSTSDMFDTPAYLMPPMSTVFQSFMDKMLNKAVVETTSSKNGDSRKAFESLYNTSMPTAMGSINTTASIKSTSRSKPVLTDEWYTSVANRETFDK